MRISQLFIVIIYLLQSYEGTSQILVDSISFGNTIYGVDISENGSLIFAAGKDTTLTVWNQKKELELTLSHKSSISSVHFLDGERTILSGSYDNTAILWDMNGKQLAVLAHDKAVISIAQNKQFLATASRDNTTRIWDRDGKLLFKLVGHSSQVNAVQFIEENNLIVTASFDNTIRFWNYQGQLVKTIEIGSAGIRSIAIFKNLLVAGHRDGSVSFLNLDGTLKTTIPAHGLNGEEYKMVNSVRFLDQKTILTAGSDGYIRWWYTNGEMISETLVAGDKNAYVSGMAISGDKMVTCSGGGNPMIKIWTLQ